MTPPPRRATQSGKDALAFIQLEKQNERLKEALLRCVLFPSSNYEFADLTVSFLFVFSVIYYTYFSNSPHRSLRDMTQETDLEQRRRIADMERDMGGIDDLQAQHATALSRLANAEIQVEDLKLQLDDALGAEDLLVQLTERNLLLGEASFEWDFSFLCCRLHTAL
jgi:dynactin 1